MEEKKSFFAKYAKILVIIGVVAGSTSGIFGALIEAPSMAIGFLRLTFALPFFAVPVLLKSRDTLKNISKRDWILTILAGAFLFGHFFTWYNAVKLTKVTSAVVLAALHPLVVLFATMFIFKRHVGFKQILAILVALGGAALITFTDGTAATAVAVDPLAGNLFAFGAGVCMGIYFQLGNEARAHVPGPTYVFLCFLSCWVCFTIGIIATGTPITGYCTMDYVYIICLTIICQIGAHAVFNLCLGHVDSLYVSTWEAGESLFATIMSIVVLSQYPSVGGWIGCFVVTVALIYYNYQVNKSSKSLAASAEKGQEAK